MDSDYSCSSHARPCFRQTADPALLFFTGIEMLQAGCSSPGAPDNAAAVVPSIICRPAHQHALNLSVLDV